MSSLPSDPSRGGSGPPVDPGAEARPPEARSALRRWASHLYVQVLAGIVIGGLIGYLKPDLGVQLQPLGDAFVSLVKMLIGPIIFTTVVAGLAGMGDLKKIGRVGAKALIYFKVVTTLALIIGLVVANVFLFLAILFGLALGRLGDHARPVLTLSNEVARVFFGIVTIVTRAAPKRGTLS